MSATTKAPELCDGSYSRRVTTVHDRERGYVICAQTGCVRRFRLGAAQRNPADSLSTGIRIPAHKVKKS